MHKASRALLGAAVGALLVCLGFFLTGFLAAKVDPQAVGVSATAAYPVLMFLAWGLPAAVLWFAVSVLTKAPFIESVLIGVAIELLIFGCLTLEAANELSASTTLLAWPIGFATALSILGFVLGSNMRRSRHE